MPFYAINALEEDLHAPDEQHTLELQLESGFKLYENALRAQGAGNPTKAKEIYNELLTLNLFEFNKHSHTPASAYKLKSLALKNIAFLDLDSLATLENYQLFHDTVGRIVGTLLESLELNNEDPAILECFYKLFRKVGLARLARLALETLISCPAARKVSLAKLVTSARNSVPLLSPSEKRMLVEYSLLVDRLEDGVARKSKLFKCAHRLKLSYEPCSPQNESSFYKEYQAFLHANYAGSQLDIPVSMRTWPNVALAVRKALASISRKRKRSLGDTYGHSLKSATAVQFIAPHGNLLVNEPLEPDSEMETEIDNEQEEVAEQAVQTVQVVQEPPMEVDKLPTEALRSSNRVQLLAPENSMNQDFWRSDIAFFEQVNSYLELCGLSFKPVMPVFSNCTFEPTADAQSFADFERLLQNWDDEHAATFLRQGAPDFNVSQPVMQLLDFATVSTIETHAPPFVSDSRDVEAYIADIGVGKSHIQVVRYKLLEHLFSSRGERRPLFWTSVFDQDLLDSAIELGEAFSEVILAGARSNPDLTLLEICECLLEFYVDRHIDLERKLRHSTKKSKEMLAKRDLYNHRVALWRGITGDLLAALTPTESDLQRAMDVLVRHQWITIFNDQIFTEDPDECIKRFKQIIALFENHYGDTTVTFPNCTHIQTASITGARAQISKYKSASIFAKVFDPVEASKDIHQTIDLLEEMLLPETRSDLVPEHTAITQFLESASVEFRLSLWYLLLDFYDKIGQRQKSREGLIRIFCTTINDCLDPNDKEEPDYEREQKICRLLCIAHDIGKRLLPLVFDGKNIKCDLPQNEALTILASVVKFVRLLHIYKMLDQAINSNFVQSPHHQTWEAASAQIRELLVIWWSLFFIFYKSSLPEQHLTKDTVNDVLSIIHEQLGTSGYCSLVGAVFLDININEMLALEWSESEMDMLQCLNCRYGLNLGNEKFQPFNHHSVTTPLKREDAVRLTKFLRRMVADTRKLTQSITRNDIKQAIEQFYEAIGEPDTSVHAIAHNKREIEDFLANTRITSDVLKSIYSGELFLNLMRCSDQSLKAIGESGIYFVRAMTSLWLYRVRKRSNSIKVEDLLEAVKFFTHDLVYCTNRLESWFGLSQAYQYMAEFGLTRDADAVQLSHDREAERDKERDSRFEFTKERGTSSKAKTSSSSDIDCFDCQRKAILCGGVATSSLQSGQKPAMVISEDYYAHVVATLWPFYGQLLYMACVHPCKLGAFSYPMRKKLFYSSLRRIEKEGPKISGETVLTVAYRYLALATVSDPGDWYSVYLSARIARLLDMPAHIAMDHLIEAQRLRTTSDAKDPARSVDSPTLVQADMIIWIYTYYGRDKLTFEQGIEYLKATSFYQPSDEVNGLTEKSLRDTYFGTACVTSLERLLAGDKRHTLHYPVYWLSTTYMTDFKNIEKAEQLMSSLVPKTASKAPVQIWRSELELPGLYFEYMYEYVFYYCNILVELKNDSLLLILARRVRKYPSIFDHRKLWEHILLCISRVVKTITGIPLRFVDRMLPQLNPEIFDERNLKLEAWITAQEASGDISPWVFAMDYALDLRKLNGNYGSNAVVDDLLLSVFLAMYELFDENPGNKDFLLGKRYRVEFVNPTNAPRSEQATDNGPDINPELIVEPQEAVVSTVFTGVAATGETSSTSGPEAKEQPEVRTERLMRKDLMSKALACLKGILPKLQSTQPKSIPPILHDKVQELVVVKSARGATFRDASPAVLAPPLSPNSQLSPNRISSNTQVSPSQLSPSQARMPSPRPNGDDSFEVGESELRPMLEQFDPGSFGL